MITARKRSLGQGDIFTPVCHSVHRGDDGILPETMHTTPAQEHVPPHPRIMHPPPPVQSMLGDTVNARAVPILLECNLVICCKWRPSDCYLPLWSTIQCIALFSVLLVIKSSLEVALLSTIIDSVQVLAFGHFEFRFQTVHMYFGLIDKIQCHEKIANIKLISLKMLVIAVWIPVCVSVKYLRIWNSNNEIPAI